MKKFENIVERIKRQIIAGRFAEGEKFPSEKELSADYDVSVQTVNKAFSILVSSGYLERRRGLGTYVAGRTKLAELRRGYSFTAGIFFESSVKNIAEADSVLGSMAFNLQHLLTGREMGWLAVSEKDGADWRGVLDQVDGFITVGDVSEEFVETVEKAKVPTVTFNRDFTGRGLASVVVNTESIAKLVESACALGHRRYLYITSEPEKQIFAIRYAAYEAAVKALPDSGVAVKRLVVPRGALERRELYPELRRAIEEYDFAFLPYDSLAILFMHLLAEHGYAVPRDLSICGYDNTPAGRHLTVPLTTIAYDTQEACTMLVETLLKMLSGVEVCPMKNIVDSWLILRGTAGGRPGWQQH